MGCDFIRNFLKYIPGFRTVTVWKMVLAGLYYLTSLLLATSGFGYVLASLSLPFIVFGIVEVIKKKRGGLPVVKNLIFVVIALLVFTTGTALAPKTGTGNLQSANTAEPTLTALEETTQIPLGAAYSAIPGQSASTVLPEQSATKEKTGVVGTVPPTASAKPETNTGINSGSNGSADSVAYVDAGGNGLIKGNISSTGEKIYHLPGDPYYNRTIPEAWFKTEKEALAAGYRAIKR